MFELLSQNYNHSWQLIKTWLITLQKGNLAPYRWKCHNSGNLAKKHTCKFEMCYQNLEMYLLLEMLQKGTQTFSGGHPDMTVV